MVCMQCYSTTQAFFEQRQQLVSANTAAPLKDNYHLDPVAGKPERQTKRSGKPVNRHGVCKAGTAKASRLIESVDSAEEMKEPNDPSEAAKLEALGDGDVVGTRRRQPTTAQPTTAGATMCVTNELNSGDEDTVSIAIVVSEGTDGQSMWHLAHFSKHEAEDEEINEVASMTATQEGEDSTDVLTQRLEDNLLHSISALPALMVTLQSHVLADGHAALPPLFLAAPGFGSSAAYFELSVQLGESRMIYGLDFDETVSDPQQIAQHHTESIQRVNPTGSVHLGGFSLGGYVSILIANNLQRAGRDVQCVFLLDSWDPGLSQLISPNKLVRDLLTGAGVPGDQLQEVLRDPVATFMQYPALNRVFSAQKLQQFLQQQDLAKVTLDGPSTWWRAVDPLNGGARVVYFKCQLQMDGQRKTYDDQWYIEAPSYSTVNVPCNHAMILTDPTASQLIGAGMKFHLLEADAIVAPSATQLPSPTLSTQHNQVTSEGIWHKIRAQCEREPGPFHGRYTKETIYWFYEADAAWVLFHGDMQEWHGWTVAGCQPRVIPSSWEPWKADFDDSKKPYYQWFVGGLTNGAFNEVDRHVLEGHCSEVAVIEDGLGWEQESDSGLGAPESCVKLSRRELLMQVAAAARVLRHLDMHKGKCVAVAMRNTSDQLVWIEACKRLAVMYTSVAPTASARSLAERVHELRAEVVLTDTWMIDTARVALGELSNTVKLVVVRLDDQDVQLDEGEVWSQDLLTAICAHTSSTEGKDSLHAQDAQQLVSTLFEHSPVVPVEANFPLFCIFTSGSTGKPKGVVHCHGYLAGVVLTMSTVFDATPGKDVTLVVATPGWITGQSYMIAGALASRVTTILSTANMVSPHPYRFAAVVKHCNISVFKAGVTFLKAVMTDPDAQSTLERYQLYANLKVSSFCAEPVNPSVQQFGMDCVTSQYVNSYWGTEHGGIVLSCPYGNSEHQPLQPDARAYALPWIFAEVWVGDQGKTKAAHRATTPWETGEVVITRPYPYLARTVTHLQTIHSSAWPVTCLSMYHSL